MMILETNGLARRLPRPHPQRGVGVAVIGVGDRTGGVGEGVAVKA